MWGTVYVVADFKILLTDFVYISVAGLVLNWSNGSSRENIHIKTLQKIPHDLWSTSLTLMD